MVADDDATLMREFISSILPLGLPFVAFFFASLGTSRCDAVTFTSTSGFDSPVTVHFGFWSHSDVAFYADNDANADGTPTSFYMVLSCAAYASDVAVDATWKAAAILSVLPLAIGALSFLRACVRGCSPKRTLLDCVLFLLAFACQGLSLFLFLDGNACKNNGVIEAISSTPLRDDVMFPETCTVSSGARCSMVATVFWGLAAFASVDAYRARKKANDAESDSTAESLAEPLMSSEIL